MNNKRIFFFIVIFYSGLLIRTAFAWDTFLLPKAVAGASAGYFRISLDDFNKIYASRWNYIYGAHVNVRVYRSYYLTLQYEKYKTDKMKQGMEFSSGNEGAPVWDEQFINVGIRMYSSSVSRWNFYSGLGLTFITVKEKLGWSVFENDPSTKRRGDGFFFELGADYIILPHVALFAEFEITSAGEGGTPGFVGYSLGGYAFQIGIDFYY